MRYDIRASFWAVSRLPFLLLFCCCRKSKTYAFLDHIVQDSCISVTGICTAIYFVYFVLSHHVSIHSYIRVFMYARSRGHVTLEQLQKWQYSKSVFIYSFPLYTGGNIKKALGTLASMYFCSLFSTRRMNSLMNSTVHTECEVEKVAGRFVASSRLLKSRMT